MSEFASQAVLVADYGVNGLMVLMPPQLEKSGSAYPSLQLLASSRDLVWTPRKPGSFSVRVPRRLL